MDKFYPENSGLKDQVRSPEETQSVADVLREYFNLNSPYILEVDTARLMQEFYARTLETYIWFRNQPNMSNHHWAFIKLPEYRDCILMTSDIKDQLMEDFQDGIDPRDVFSGKVDRSFSDTAGSQTVDPAAPEEDGLDDGTVEPILIFDIEVTFYEDDDGWIKISNLDPNLDGQIGWAYYGNSRDNKRVAWREQDVNYWSASFNKNTPEVPTLFYPCPQPKAPGPIDG